MIKRQEGFSLIEALIALFVLSVGLIGMAGMQTKALISAQNSYLDSVATLAAVDAQERLWEGLADNKDCATIGKSELKDIKDDWVKDWFKDVNSPLFDLESYSFEAEGNCEFSVRITASEEPLSFNIRLPDLRDKE